MTRLSLLTLAISLVGCSCPPPHKDETQPRHLTENLLHFVTVERYDKVLARCSRRTREDPGGLGRQVLFGRQTLGEVVPGLDSRHTLTEALLAASHIGFMPRGLEAPKSNPPSTLPTALWWLIEDKLEPDADRPHLLRLLLVKEVEDGESVWRLGLQEQLD